VVWDELLSHWSNENTVKPVIMAWNHINKSREAAEKGFKSIVCPYQAVYIDFMQVPAHQTIIDEPYYGGWSDNHVNSLETVYALNPLGALSGKEDFCMGVQANLWAETLNDYEELQYQLLPRMLALAEIGWLENKQKSWDSFYKRLQQQDEILDALGYTYAKHYILPDAQTEEEILMQEVSDILAAGQPGHPAQSVYDELKAIYDVALLMPSDATILTVVKEKLNAYKKAAITQPQEGKLYQIVSASTYYKKQFAGSTMYQDGTQVRFHYTPQLEPEELWYFVKKNNADGPYFHLQNACSKQYLQMPAYNQAVTMGDKTTDALRVDLATIASGDFTFVPGAVTLSAVDGYSVAMNNNVKRLSAQTTGLVFAKDDAALCYSGTWKVVEVKDFTAQLKGLLKKCDAILRDAQPGAIGEPSEAALNYLRTQVADPIRHQIELGDVVSEEAYLGYLERYNEFLAMPKASVMDAISENHYYFIQNAYFTDNYASCTASMLQPKALDKKNDACYWYFVKNDDGTVTIVNKKTEREAFISKNAEGTIVYANYKGSGNATWTLQEITTDQNATGIAIVDATDTYSWYTNPSAFANVVLKPKNWGASIWNLIQADAIPTGIENIQRSSEAEPLYDLSGRRVTKPTRGIYVNGKGQKVMK
ncbi:MAG: family 20 glycosylhydrolase, partial [Bacteroidaceae bacterium]|nr:family 20 glycosylhydrolase [Bacteroidaceae bacterium]